MRRKTGLFIMFAVATLFGCGGESDDKGAEAQKEEPTMTESEDECQVIVRTNTSACAEEEEMCGTTRVLADGRCCIIGGNCEQP